MGSGRELGLRAPAERGPDRVSPLAVIIADTHIPRRARVLPEGLLAHLGRADLVLHAGDLMDPSLLEELSACVPVRAVRGNLDPPDLDLPEGLEFKLGGVRVAMIHDSGASRDAGLACGGASRTPASSSSATPTSPFWKTRVASCCSTPEAPRTGGASRTTPSHCSVWRGERCERRSCLYKPDSDVAPEASA